jgi:hypothetical protein
VHVDLGLTERCEARDRDAFLRDLDFAPRNRQIETLLRRELFELLLISLAGGQLREVLRYAPFERNVTDSHRAHERFAGDEELPMLCRDVLEGKLATSKEIKQRVKDWQPDWLRA